MEAVPRLPMIKFETKISSESTSFGLLKQHIAEYYHEDAEAYSKEIYTLESLRRAACHPSEDLEGLSVVKRYYCQLHSLQHRFNLSGGDLNFSWKDVYTGVTHQNTSLKYEMAAVLYNIGALHTQLGVKEDRTNSESLKIACTHFQCAAWAFGHIKETYPLVLKDDLSMELMAFNQQICLAHAQECIMEKSLTDNRKSGLIAKVTAQIIIYYNSALAILLNNTEDGQELSQIVTNKNFKEFRKYIKFKISYLSAILYLYQGQESEEMQKMGERVILYQNAMDKLEEAKKESKGLQNMEAINESLIFTTDVIEGKRKIAKNENDFIYHEEIPDLVNIPAIKGANLVNGIPFNTSDPKVAGVDIFQRLIPMKTHEISSLYSEEKASLLRTVSTKISDKNNELNKFISSLNLELLQQYQQKHVNFDRLPDGLVDRCAAINAKSNAINDLVQSMANLAEICAEVETILAEIKILLHDEEVDESKYHEKTGGLRTIGGNNMTELNREYLKYNEAHAKAGESNETLRKAMGLHVANLKILAQPLHQLQLQVPKISINLDDPAIISLRNILQKVDEMQKQREQVYTQLREAISNDDITAILISCEDKTSYETIFKKELEKHHQPVQIIEQNILAQENILNVLTDVYAKCAPLIKGLADTKAMREHFYSSLSASYDVYEDLLSKCSKGLEFYKKLQNNVQKLHSRIKAAHDVQDEERQQRLKTNRTNTVDNHPKSVPVSGKSSGHKLKDYLNSEGKINTSYSNNILPVRPNPLGSENTTSSYSNYNHNYYGNPIGSQNVPPASQIPTEYDNSSYYNYPTVDMSQQSKTLSNVSQSYANNQTQFSNNAVSMGYTNPIYQNTPYYPQVESNTSFGVPQMNQSESYDSGYKPDMQTNSNINAMTQQLGNLDINQSIPVNPYNAYNMTMNPSSNVDYNSQNVDNASTGFSLNNNSMSASSSSSDMNNTKAMPLQYYGGYSELSQQQIQQDHQSSQLQPNVTPYMPDNNLQQSFSYASHPGYSLNPQTGTYDYNSGYQNQEYVSQYSNPMTHNQTYTNMNNYGISTNSSSQHYTQSQSFPTQDVSQQPMSAGTVQESYYNLPYGQSNTSNSYDNPIYSSNQIQPRYENNNIVANATDSSLSEQNQYTYMNSNANFNTNTTNSSNGFSVSSPHVQNLQMQQVHNTDSQSNIEPAEQAIPASNIADPKPVVPLTSTSSSSSLSSLKVLPRSENLDLLSGIDFSINTATIDVPILEPRAIVTEDKTPSISFSNIPASSSRSEIMNAEPKTVNEDIESLKLNYDWVNEMTNVVSEEAKPLSNLNTKFIGPEVDPFADTTVLKWFHKEVERLEKFIETFLIKTLNGSTPLDGKWKEIHDILEKDASKRTVSVAKLYPEKNRSLDSLPYDHSRVLLPTSTDDYINAVHLKDLGANNLKYILTQTPMPNTINDFWNMIWSQKANLCVCLHTPNEILDKFWPAELNQECTYGEFIVSLLKVNDLSNCIEYNLCLVPPGSGNVVNIKLLQIKAWPKKRPENIISIAHNIISTYKGLTAGALNNSPIVMNCLTGADRCGFVTLAITTILATETRRPTLINVADVWYRLCVQRKGVLRDIEMLQESFTIVLSHGHSILNKRGIMTSYQITTDITKKEYKEEVCDPLNDLDPLWKLKQNK